MKVFVILCLSIIFCSSYTQGGLLKDVVESIHETAHHVREDIENAIGHRDKNHSKTDIPNANVKPTTEKPVTDNGIAIQSPKTDVVVQDSVAKTEAGKSEPTVTQLQPTTVPSTATTKDTQDGRAVISGGCAKDFRETSDGRCKPTFPG